MRHYKTDTIALRKLMIDAGYNTISELAKVAKIDRTPLGKIINGKAQPSADQMDKLASALKMNPITAGSVFFAENLRNT